jgi:micrococcal nuclease
VITVARNGIATFLTVLGIVWSVPASADPCEGPLPRQSAHFSGVVQYIGDGDSLCVGPEGKPDQWIEVRLGDFYAPELHAPGGQDAKRRLKQLVSGRVLACRAGRRSYDRVVGYCTLNGQPVGMLLRRTGGIQGGRGWRR